VLGHEVVLPARIVGGEALPIEHQPDAESDQNELAIGRELRILSSYGDGEDDGRL
jgi:hypothetical protein